MQLVRRVAANPQTKPIDLGCESAENWQLPSSPTLCPPDVRYPRAAAMRICVTLL